MKLVVDKKINKIFKGEYKLAKEQDWSTEYLDKKLSVKIVANTNDAINHILKYGTMHTDGILQRVKAPAKNFIKC